MNRDYKIGDKVDYYVHTAFRWHGLVIKRNRLYCHGFIKAIRNGRYYMKVSNAERIDVVREGNIFGRLDSRQEIREKKAFINNQNNR